MEIRTFIQSGIIERYVCGMATAAEAAELEALARQSPEIRNEIEEVEAVMFLFSQANAIVVSEGEREKILKRVYAIEAGTTVVEKPQPIIKKPDNIPPPSVQPESRQIPIFVEEEKSNFLPWAVAGIMALIALTFGYMWYLEKNKIADSAVLNKELVEKKQDVSTLKEKLDIITNPNTQVLNLKPLENPDAPNAALITVYFNAARKLTYLSIKNLPQPDAEHQYQLWAVTSTPNSAPLDAGLIEYTLGDIQEIRTIEGVKTFVVTLEPLGGSPTPSLDKQLVVMGSF